MKIWVFCEAKPESKFIVDWGGLFSSLNKPEFLSMKVKGQAAVQFFQEIEPNSALYVCQTV